jgi:hypothetical protein
MNTSKSSHESAKGNEKLRNYDLSVDEIRLVKSIEEMTKSAKNLERLDPQSSRAKFARIQIKKLFDELEALRDNTLIR